jgi:hypothetical protein
MSSRRTSVRLVFASWILRSMFSCHVYTSAVCVYAFVGGSRGAISVGLNVEAFTLIAILDFLPSSG